MASATYANRHGRARVAGPRLPAGRSARPFDHFKAQLRELALSVQHEGARRAAPMLTTLTQVAYGTGKTVYGEPRPAGVDGRRLDLRQSGDAQAALRFVSDGTQVRCKLGTTYTRYLVGKYRVLPNGPLPAGWHRELNAIINALGAP